MQRFRHSLRLLILSLGLSILGLNLVMASVPRCTFLLSLFTDSHKHAAVAEEATASCHEAPAASPSEGPQWRGGQFCECSLLSCLVFHLPSYAPDSYIAFNPVTERLLVFPASTHLASFIADPEAPPPRA